MDKVFMLLFSFVLNTPEGPRDEIFQVYSKHFDTQESCESTLNSWSYLIKAGAADKLNGMLKKGFAVELKSVVCAVQPVLPNKPQDEPSTKYTPSNVG
jgi:hypothetical protein